MVREIAVHADRDADHRQAEEYGEDQ